MTRQIKEYLEAESVSYWICSPSTSKIFDPEIIGVERGGLSTACWKGWYSSWKLMGGRLYLDNLNTFGGELPPICGIEAHGDKFSLGYKRLMLPWGYTGEITVIPSDDQDRAWGLYYGIAENDEVVPQFVLHFEKGRLMSARNTSYLIRANEDEEEPGTRMNEGRIFGEVPTPFDELVYKSRKE